MVRELDRGAPTVGNSDYYPFACSVQICKHGVDVYSPTTVFVPYFKGLDSKGYRQDIPGWKVDDYPLESRPQIIYSPAPIDSFKHFPDSRTFHVMSNESNITDGQAFAYISYWLTEGERQREASFTMHAAALSLEDRGVLLIGDKGAGKTSTLLNLATRYKGEVIANDLCIVRHRAAEERVVLENGSKKMRLRLQSIMSKFPQLLDLFPDKDQEPWTTKVVVNPSEIGIKISESETDLAQAFLIHLNNKQDEKLKLERVTGIGAYFELYENLSRIIRGSAISIFSAGGKILGYIPSLESEITHQNKVTFLEHLIKDKGLWFISGGNLDEICDTIYDLSQK